MWSNSIWFDTHKNKITVNLQRWKSWINGWVCKFVCSIGFIYYTLAKQITNQIFFQQYLSWTRKEWYSMLVSLVFLKIKGWKGMIGHPKDRGRILKSNSRVSSFSRRGEWCRGIVATYVAATKVTCAIFLLVWLPFIYLYYPVKVNYESCW